MQIFRRFFAHDQKIERHLGIDAQTISSSMRPWYADGIPILNVPGISALPGGEFSGQLAKNAPGSLSDYYASRAKRTWRNFARQQLSTANAGFASYSDLINEWTSSGKGQSLFFNKSLGTQVIGGCTSSWFVGSQPSAGGVSSAAPGGRATDKSTAGAFAYTNATSPDLMALLSGFIINTVGGSILLYDRLFDVIKTASSTTTEAVTGVPTRYVGSTAGSPDYPSGNFMFPEVTSAGALGATAHNWTVCKYTNQAGTTGQSAPSIAGVSGSIANSVDLALGNWFIPLAAGDTGVKALTQMQNSASVTGALNFVVGHPLGFLACEVALRVFPFDFIVPGGVFNPQRVFDNACLSFLSIMPAATTAPVITGQINLCSG